MMFRLETLRRIKSGEITLAFRRWRKPSAKTGTIQKTAVGELEIENVELTTLQKITQDDLNSAGHASLAELRRELGTREGRLYKIALRYKGEDSRIALRENNDLSKADLSAIETRLGRLDKASRIGPWTTDLLQGILENPGLRAADLSVAIGYEKEWLKLNVRKLKNLGLTASLEVGYQLSPRGLKYLELIDSSSVA